MKVENIDHTESVCPLRNQRSILSFRQKLIENSIWMSSCPSELFGLWWTGCRKFPCRSSSSHWLPKRRACTLWFDYQPAQRWCWTDGYWDIPHFLQELRDMFIIFFWGLVISPQPGRKAWSARTWMSSPHANMQMAGSLAKGRGNISEDLSVIRAGQCVSKNVIPHKRPSNKSKKRENRMQNEEKRNAGWSACAFWSWRSWPSPIVLLRRWTGRGSPSYFKELTEIIELHSPNVVETDLQMTKQVIETDLIWICK